MSLSSNDKQETSAAIKNAQLEGWLTKQGAVVKNWKRRWFVLKDKQLYYFKKPSDLEPKGTVNLEDVTIAHATHATKRQHCFGIYHPGRRSYFLQADTQDDMLLWVNAIRGDEKRIGLIDFDILSVLGKGSFGKVLLVKKKNSGELLAMKVLKKESVIKQNEIQHTRTERAILQRIKHPFIVGLQYAFQTNEKLYMVMDYVAGGELYFHLRNERRFPEKRVKLYMAELVLALEYLHKLNIIYRDLKPENILLGTDGHLHLTDFGLSKIMFQQEATHTFCGTPYYLAPEMLKGDKGHGKGVDWWSLGVLMYEMLCGMPPFYSRNMNNVYEKILHGEIRYPNFISPQAKDLISKFLIRDPDARIGATEEDAAPIKEHEFFADIDWEKILKKEYEPDFKPVVSKEGDVSNFDTMFTRERPVDSFSEGNADPQPNFRGFSYAKSEMDDMMQQKLNISDDD
eukprot:TRINITY_DN2155_c0_g1::TRINITY_DN2155_c0_g1_i1::g.12753::m.12753 TRINITY_DN2155_c0_g1::TRINITY_DN2155_c0_g1_i1::g.12753  ORF type:complete len:456 (-),score=146.91,sp/P54644/KRAC_DICDI/44.54/1e-132,Pkinase/PF00069.20/1.9e-75,Pkinase_Tyr/PF07714.12/9.4e-36,PH/PF00169.24/1.3e-23,PH_11/PF15413.1/1.1e-08,PH_3/PF14593.1/1e-05,PH_3/PF14593.1/1.6e+02,Kinase-like/PF14531.1/19,Kinase-like/PF14531.1/3.4e-05,Pkinase_C/PF00433.19/1.4e-05,PH_9/PF15410.1/9.9e-05,PH_9/PF15410.1/4.6e+03,PH_8/PF15409.1/0.00068,PH